MTAVLAVLLSLGLGSWFALLGWTRIAGYPGPTEVQHRLALSRAPVIIAGGAELLGGLALIVGLFIRTLGTVAAVGLLALSAAATVMHLMTTQSGLSPRRPLIAGGLIGLLLLLRLAG